jgi:hypothetical protein
MYCKFRKNHFIPMLLEIKGITSMYILGRRYSLDYVIYLRFRLFLKSINMYQSLD